MDGQPVGAASPVRRVAAGLVHVPVGRELFGPLSVEDNLRIGLYGRYAQGWSLAGGYPSSLRSRADVEARLGQVFQHFPMLNRPVSPLSSPCGSAWSPSMSSG